MRIRELVPWRSRERDLSRREGRAPATTFQQQMNRLFDDFVEGFDLGPFGKSGGADFATLPKIDVAETDSDLQVTAELPGMKEEDIEVTLSEGHLVIRGEKKAEKEDKTKNYHRIERSYGSFHRSIPLSAEIDEQKVDASFENGVLKIVLPKTATTANAEKKIPVRRLN
jgi:HSP20 family protein